MWIKRLTLVLSAPLITALAAGSCAFAQRTGTLDFTLFDAPYNVTHGVRGPSMQQSLDLSIAAYELAHSGIERAFGQRKRLGRTAIALFDLATTIEFALPLTSVWVHEEFHRTVMGQRGVNSFNDVYRFDFDASWIAVSHVKDDDIARLKRDHPTEWVRTNAAGIEGELLLVRELEARRFFGKSTAWHLPLYWLTKVGTIGYVASGNWYVKRADLTTEERRYLERQGKLQLLNLVDPFLFGLHHGIALGHGQSATRVIAGLSHYLTSFGHTVDANLFVRRGSSSLTLVAHAYANGRVVLPGVEGELLDAPLTVGGRSLSVSPRIALWLQPEGQQFSTSRADAGGLLGVRVRAALSPRLSVFAELEAKTAGWVAGVPYLSSNVTLRVGLAGA